MPAPTIYHRAVDALLVAPTIYHRAVDALFVIVLIFGIGYCFTGCGSASADPQHALTPECSLPVNASDVGDPYASIVCCHDAYEPATFSCVVL